jgi:hypothetical protein
VVARIEARIEYAFTACIMIRRGGANRLESLPQKKAEFLEPMDCDPVTKLPDGPEWIFEIKLDGYRSIGVKSASRRQPIFAFSTSSMLTASYRARGSVPFQFISVEDVYFVDFRFCQGQTCDGRRGGKCTGLAATINGS